MARPTSVPPWIMEELEDEPMQLDEAISSPKSATVIELSSGKPIFIANANVSLRREDQEAGKTVLATLHGGKESLVKVMACGGMFFAIFCFIWNLDFGKCHYFIFALYLYLL
jgi:hypothetical protein